MSERLEEIRLRAKAASNGPWKAVDLRHQKGGQIRIFGGRGEGLLANVLRAGSRPAADADFIAQSRGDVEWLLAEVDRLAGADFIERGEL